MKKLLIVVILVIALVVSGLLWWPKNPAEKSDTLVLHGNVDIRQISLAFDGTGRITELFAEEGDTVEAGAVLGTLDTHTLFLETERAKANIEMQQQTLLRLKNGSRPEEVAQARSRLNVTKAEAALAEQDLERLQGISDSTQGRGVSAQNLDIAKNKLEVARARVDEQREALNLAELGSRSEEVAGAEAQLKASRAQLALLEHQLELGSLKSPTDAVVRSRLLEPGDMATPQRPVFTLALTDPKWVRVYVGEVDLGHVKPGMEARVVTDTHPDQPVKGNVGYISSVAEFTPKSVQTEELRTSLVYEVRVIVDDADNRLRLGQPATVHLATGGAK